MRYLLLILLFVSSGCSSTQKERLTTTILLVRHAEKQKGRDPSLTQTGKIRATSLIAQAKAYKVTGVYSTNYKRTLETATPLAESLSIKINSSIHPTDYKALVADIKKNHEGNTVLVVGHSNTVPAFVNHLSPKENLPMIGEKDFSNLYIIKLLGKDVQLEKIRY